VLVTVGVEMAERKTFQRLPGVEQLSLSRLVKIKVKVTLKIVIKTEWRKGATLLFL
jgi:hypothetical protein